MWRALPDGIIDRGMSREPNATVYFSETPVGRKDGFLAPVVAQFIVYLVICLQTKYD